MRINKMTASFGKLENESLSFHPGLNVIYAPNEGGKSTWCAFIRAMLYGVDTAERARAGYLPDKLRYAPWSGAPMEGSMELTAGGCDITITRSTRQKNAPMREFSATYTGSSVPVEGLNGSNAGEMLTGVSRDVFRRSAFIGQGAVAVTGSPELEKRISSIVSTGEEQTSYSEADERLRQWQRKRRYNRRGLLPELEGKMDEAQRRLELMEDSLQDIESLEKRLEQAGEECRQLEQQVTDSRKRQRREALDRLSKGRGEAERCSAEHDAALAKLSQCREDMRNSRFGLQSLSETEEQVQRDMGQLKELRERASQKPSALLAIIFFVLAIAAAAAYTALGNIVVIIAAAVFCAVAVFLLMGYSKKRQAINQALEDRREILRKYQVSGSGELAAALEEHRRLAQAAEEAEREEKRCRLAYENARELQRGLEENAMAELDFAAGSSEAARLSRELNEARDRAQQLSRQIAEMNGRLAAMGDPLVLSSALSSMREDYDTISKEYEAISLAVDTLKEADTEIQSRFSPELGKLAAEYMSAVTGGRYLDVFINRDFSARTRTSGDSIAREAEYLSAGTLDLMYLAVRLAVCELALPEGENCPLIIDDALVNLDDTRLEQAMELLKQIARDRQVILFSCREVRGTDHD